MREVKLRLTRLNDQVDELFHVGVVPLQVEGDKLWDVELQVETHWLGQVRVDAALGQLVDCLRLARV